MSSTALKELSDNVEGAVMSPNTIRCAAELATPSEKKRSKSLAGGCTPNVVPFSSKKGLDTPPMTPDQTESDAEDDEKFEDCSRAAETAAPGERSPTETLAKEMRRLSMELGSLTKGGGLAAAIRRGSGEADMPIYSQSEFDAKLATQVHRATDALRAELAAAHAEERGAWEAAQLAESEAGDAARDLLLSEALAEERKRAAEAAAAAEERHAAASAEALAALEERLRSEQAAAVEALEAVLSESKAENAQLLEVFGEVEDKVSEMESVRAERDEWRAKHEALSGSLEGLSADSSVKKSLLAAKDAELQRLRASESALRSAMEEQKSAFERREEQLRKEEAERRRKAAADVKEIVEKKAKDQFAKAQKLYKQLQSECGRLKEDAKAAEAARSALAAERDEARAALEAARRAEGTGRAEAAELAARAAELEGLLEAARAKQKEAEEDAKNQRTTCNSFWKSNEALKEERARLAAEKEALEGEKAELQQICEETMLLLEQQQGAAAQA